MCKRKRDHYTEEYVENFISGESKRKDKTGHTYNKIEVVKHKEKHVWFMRCFCGTLFSGDYYNLRSGSILSCGCSTFDNMRATKGVSVEEIISRLSKYKPQYKIIEKGRSLKDKWFMICNDCNTEFTATPEVMLDKRGRLSCKCSKQYRRTYSEWVEDTTSACKTLGLSFISFENNRPKKAGQFTYKCNTCDNINTTRVEHVINGHGCPICSGQNQRQNYLFTIFEEGIPVAHKIGIAIDYKRRLQEQKSKTDLEVLVDIVYQMPSSEICKTVEKDLISKLPVSYLNKEQYPDGFTETIPLAYRDLVVAHYNKHGTLLPEESDFGKK